MSSFVSRAFKRIVGFGLSTIVVGLSNVLVIPLIVRTATASGWASIALAQAIGTIGGIVVAFGWGVIGPALIASSDQNARHLEYARSAIVRVAIWIPLAVACTALAATLAPTFKEPAMIMAAASCAAGLSAIWYFVGSSDPRSLFLYDTTPRTLGLVVGALVLALTKDLWWFAIIQLVAALLAFVIPSFVILRRPNTTPWSELRPASLFRSTRKQYYGIGTGITSAAYQALPTVLVGAFAPVGLAQFALADRLQKLSNTALRPVSQTLQGWVPALGQPSRERVLRALGFAAMAGILSGLALALLGPIAGQFLGSGQIALGFNLTVPIGLTLCLSLISQCSGMSCLMALGKSKHVLVSSVAGAVACVPLCIVLASTAGAPGAAWSIAISELIVTVYQLLVLRRHFHNKR